MIGRLLEALVLFLARSFPARYRLIPREGDGVLLLRQFKVFSFGKEQPRGVPPWYHASCYLQSFVNPEHRERMHVHRWRYMLSFVLSGQFVEERPARSGFDRYRIHTAPAIYTMNDRVIHRVTFVAPRTWTLFFMFGHNRYAPPSGWGYFEKDGSYTPWDKLITEPTRVKAL